MPPTSFNFGGHRDDEVGCLVVRQTEADAVQAVEGDDGGERQPLVAVDEGVVTRWSPAARPPARLSCCGPSGIARVSDRVTPVQLGRVEPREGACRCVVGERGLQRSRRRAFGRPCHSRVRPSPRGGCRAAEMA